MTTWSARARPSSSRPTAWPRARAWWWPRTLAEAARRHRLHAAGRHAGRGPQRRRRPGRDRGLPEGEEASFIVLSDGRNVTPLATSQDHKRLHDGDRGPTPAAWAPIRRPPWSRPAVHARVMREIILPTLRGMEHDGIPYTGFLYAGLMIGPGRPAEDAGIQLPHGRPRGPAHPDAPEVRPARTAAGRHRRPAGHGAAAMGPPPRPRGGDGRRGLSAGPAPGRRDPQPAQAHRGRGGVPRRHRTRDGQVVTTGGRVLCVTALGDSVKAAQARAYEVLRGIAFDGAQYRRDIGFRAITARRLSMEDRASRRARLAHRPAAAHHATPCARHRRPALPCRRLGARSRASRCRARASP